MIFVIPSTDFFNLKKLKYEKTEKRNRCFEEGKK